MSTATSITDTAEKIRKNILYVYKCINNLFYILERYLKQSFGPKWDGHYLERKM